MSRLTLRQLRVSGPSTYEAEFVDAEGETVLVSCVIDRQSDMPILQPDPDIFMWGNLAVREVVKAVAAFDDAVEASG